MPIDPNNHCLITNETHYGRAKRLEPSRFDQLQSNADPIAFYDSEMGRFKPHMDSHEIQGVSAAAMNDMFKLQGSKHRVPDDDKTYTVVFGSCPPT